MALEQLTALPDSITAGSTVTYTSAQSDYLPSAGWAMALYLAGASVAHVHADVVNDQFVITISAATTATLTPGKYIYSETVTKGEGVTLEQYEVGRGTVMVAANITTATAGSTQSYAEKMLASVEAQLAARLTADVESYSIGGRSVVKTKLEELHRQRAYWARKVAAERNRRNGVWGRSVYAVFGGGNQ